jgi:DNA-binding transcriptional LysR family regulator
MLDLVLLQSFVAVAETLSFTAAASALRTSQSTVSKHVRSLEVRARCTLLARDSREVELTDAGDAMLLFARQILTAHDTAMGYFTGRGSGSRIRIGVEPSQSISVLPAVLRDFRRGFPDVEVDLRAVEKRGDLVSQVRSGEVDFALVAHESAPHARILLRQRQVWVGAPGLELPAEDPVPIVLLQGIHPSTMWLFRALEEAGSAWRISCTAHDWHGVYAALRAGLGLVIMPERMIPDDLAEIRAAQLPELSESTFALIDNPRAPRDLVRELRASFRRVVDPVDHPLE